ncbi:hypothetical protein Gasu2_02100, partial [Galdieria sulphuraria]
MDLWDARHLSQMDHTWLQGKQFTKPDCLKTKHPVEQVQEKSFEEELYTRHKLVALALGSQVPLRIDIERHTILGRDEEITFEDVLSPPEE